MTFEDMMEPNKQQIKFTPRIISMPEPGQYCLGGNPLYKRSIRSYVAILKKINHRRKLTCKERGRFLCQAFVREEFSKYDLATKNCTGKSRDKDKKIVPIEKLDQELLAAIFAQARHQFQDFSDIHTDSQCETIKAINIICKNERSTNVAKRK